MVKKILFIFLFFLFYCYNNVHAGYFYNYICDDNFCHNTNRNVISNNDYYLINVYKINFPNFSNYLDTNLVSYENYYDGVNYEISGYCEGTCDEIINKNLTLKELLLIDTPFNIGKEKFFGLFGNDIIASYDSGKDYLFSNFSEVIISLHDGFPIGDLKEKLSDLSPNLLSYSNLNNTFSVRNVCNKLACTESKEISIGYTDTNEYVFVSGDIKSANNFKTDTFKVSNDYNISKLLIKAGESIDFNFGFEDYLDQTLDKTEYEYRIYYNYDGEGLPNVDDYFLKETILVDGNTFEVTSPNIGSDIIGDYVDLTVLNETDKEVRVGIKEGIQLTKVGNINFYLAVKNITSGDSFDMKLVNSVPLTVLASDDIKKSDTTITSAFSPELNSEAYGFNEDQPFSVEVKLFDEYGNIHNDDLSGYDISISAGSSQYIELSIPGSGVYSKTLSGVKSNNLNTLQFDFRITKSGYHDLNGFNITAKGKVDSTTYESPIKYYILYNVIPSNLYDGEQKMRIYIKQPIYSTLPISCGQTVNINFVCTSDNFSGCNDSGNTNITYDSQSDNGKTGTLSIIDKAYNKRIYTYTVNHIDRTAPIITIHKGLEELNGSDYSYIVNEDYLKINFYEWTTSSCEAEVDYLVQLDGNTLTSGLLFGENSNFIVNNFFEKSGEHTLYIKATDKYGNYSEKTLNIKLFPSSIDSDKSIITLNNGPKNLKYADFDDTYNYTISFKDKFGNSIYNKELLELNTDCSIYTGCNNLKTILQNSGVDALNESYDLLTDNNGEVSLNIKSLAPGVFKEIFKVKMHDWDNNYNNLITKSSYYVGKFSSENSFLKPFYGDLSIIEGGTYPEIGKYQKYKIQLTNLSSSGSFYSNGDIELSKNTIENKVDGHFWREFNLINDYFGNNLIDYLGFSGVLDANDNILTGVELLTNEFTVTYNIGENLVKYFLDDFGLNGCNLETIGLKVNGIIQGDGKSSITGQDEEFSEILKSDLRNQIKINGYNLVKGLNSGDVINGVKYIEGDINISGNNLGYETLVVKDGNVTITGDLNTNGDKLGIIVLKDNYLVKTDYTNAGNVYVNNNVETIDAVIYADGGFISARDSNYFYSDLELNKLLTLKGSLFTRNTIGGAVKANTDYLLPGGQKTTSFDLAKLYDLNYVRLVNNDCSLSENYSFLINYNSSIQTDPPKGFGN